MTVRALLPVLLLVAASPLLAQTVTVRSGEHGDFSRLVFEAPADVAWTLGRGADGYRLQFDNPALDFSLARVFELIPRTRLSDIRLDEPGLLDLRVPEGVHAQAFSLRPGIVVLDLHDGAAPPDSPFEAPLPGDEPEPEPPAARPAVRLPIDMGLSPPPAMVGEFLKPIPSPAAVDPRVKAAREELMQQIGRAAAQGLLEPAITPPPSPSPAPSPEPAPEPASQQAETAPPEPVLPGLSDRPNMRVETSIDRGFGPDASGQAKSSEGESCLPDSLFDFGGWGGDLPPAALIAERRGAFLNMRDTPDPEGSRNLVRAYLALGFGAEARTVIDVVGMDDRDARVWRELAAIVDRGQADRPEVFDGQLSCSTRAALWASLARPEIPRGSRVDEAAVIRGFSELPIHLRRHLGPILAERFLASGNQPAAIRIRNAVARAGDETRSEELTLVEARLDLSQGQTDLAHERIDEVLAEGGLASPDAVALRLDSDLSEGAVPEADTIALAEALAYERRGTEIGMRLLSLAIRGHAARANFQTAFGMLVHHGLESQEDLATEVLLGLVERGPDADLLREAYSGILINPAAALRPEARLAVAERLLTLGFATRAEEILNDIPPQGTPLERMARARMAFAQGRPGEALQYLSGLQTPEADILRARAVRAQGDLKSAAEYYAAAGQTDRQADLAWQSRDWPTVQTAGPDAQRGYVALRETTPASAYDPAAAPSLATARTVLDGSTEMRSQLESLLVTPPELR